MSEHTRLTLKISGKIFPSTRMNAHGKWTGRAKQYLAWKEFYAWAIKEAWDKKPLAFPVLVGMNYWGESRRGDWDNLKKAVIDALVYAGVFPNDGLSYVLGDLPGRFMGADKNPRVEIIIETIGETK